MLKKILIGSFLLSMAAFAGCSYFDKKLAQKSELPSQREQTCADLKNQITFSDTDIRTDDNQREMPNKTARAVKQYKKYRCNEFERR